MQNIFDGVSRRNEDAATELLRNLMKATYIREMILFNLGIESNVYSEIKEENIVTQVGIETVGRPDIVINSKNAIIFIENKIRKDTELQLTQTRTYIDELTRSTKKYKKMIYLIPDNYKHKENIELLSKQYNIVKICIWEQLLAALYEKELDKWNEVVSQSLGHLSSLILQKEASIKLTREEIVIMLSPKDLINANSLFIKAKEFIARIDSKIVPLLGNDFDYSDWSWGENESEMGKYIRYKNKPYIFYGYNFALLRDHPEENEYLFALDIEKSIVKQEHLIQKNYNYYEYKDWVYIKLDKYSYTNFEDIDEIVKELVEKITESV